MKWMIKLMSSSLLNLPLILKRFTSFVVNSLKKMMSSILRAWKKLKMKKNLKESWKLWKKKIGKKRTGKRKKIGKKSRLVFLFLFLLIFFLVISIAPRKINSKEKIIFYLPEGSSSLRISELLKEKGIILSKWSFIIWAKILGLDRKLKPGYYELTPSINIFDLLKKLSSGEIIKVKVTFPEGINLDKIGEILEEKLSLSKENFLNLAKNPKSLNNIKRYFEKIPDTLEGYLFPATYDFPLGIKERDVIYIMLNTFFKKIEEIPNWKEELKNKNINFEDWVILASIVEKEAKYEDERPLIAGVFLNRLKIGYKLQSCATVEYVFNFKKPILSYDDLKVESPYNTYIHYGLPPTPICSPSLSSLKAVLYPKGDYLFFISKGNGRHYFAKTYEEHLRFQKELKRGY